MYVDDGVGDEFLEQLVWCHVITVRMRVSSSKAMPCTPTTAFMQVGVYAVAGVNLPE